jgi:hypothetical protein
MLAEKRYSAAVAAEKKEEAAAAAEAAKAEVAAAVAAAEVLCKYGARGALLYDVNQTCRTVPLSNQAREGEREKEREREWEGGRESC